MILRLIHIPDAFRPSGISQSANRSEVSHAFIDRLRCEEMRFEFTIQQDPSLSGSRERTHSLILCFHRKMSPLSRHSPSAKVIILEKKKNA